MCNARGSVVCRCPIEMDNGHKLKEFKMYRVEGITEFKKSIFEALFSGSTSLISCHDRIGTPSFSTPLVCSMCG